MHLLIFTRKAREPKIVRLPRLAASGVLLLALAAILLGVQLYLETGRLAVTVETAAGRGSGLRAELTRAGSRVAGLERQINESKSRAASFQGVAVTVPTASGRHYVQVASHRDSADAAASAASFRSLTGRIVEIHPARLPSGLWQRVLVGPFADAGRAGAWADSLRQTGTIADYYLRELKAEEPPEN